MSKPPRSIPRQLFYSSCFFSLALLIITTFTFICWVVLSTTIKVPSTATLQTEMGLLDGLRADLKPEPVESYVFLLSTVFGVVCLAAAAFLSTFQWARLSPVIKMSPLILLALITFWFSQINVPPGTFSGNAIYSAIATTPIVFFVLTALLCPAIWLLCKYEERNHFFLLGISTLIVAWLSTFILITNMDGIVLGGHYQLFVHPIIQDWLGKGIHLNQKSLYGMYPIMLRPIWLIFGEPTNTMISGVMAILMFASYTAVLVFMYAFSQFKSVAITCGFFAVTYSLLAVPFWPTDVYFQFVPLRLLFPALSLLFIAIPFIRLRYKFFAYIALAFGLVWNLESGVIGLVTFGVFQCASKFSRNWRLFFKVIAKNLLFAFTAIAIVTIIICAYYFFRFERIPQFGNVGAGVKLFTAGYGSKPMPLFGWWLSYLIIYSIAIFASLRRIYLSIDEKSVTKAASLLALAAMGLMWFRYYQGRSVPVQLMFAGLPAACCLGFIADIAIGSISKNRVTVVRALTMVIGAPVFAGIFVWITSNPLPDRKLSHFFSSQVTSPVDELVKKNIDDFRSISQNHADQLLVVSSTSYLVQLKLGTPNPVNVNGMPVFAFDSEMKDLASALIDPNTKMAIFQNEATINHPAIKPLLSSLFEQLPFLDDSFCFSASEATVFRFVRRHDGEKDAYSKSLGTPPQNLARGKAALQSSSLGGLLATAAVDGVRDGHFGNGSITHTMLQTDPWWQVDLGRSTPISSINIWNRTDCCSDRLKNYWVFVSEAPFEKDARLGDLTKRNDLVKTFQPSSPCPVKVLKIPNNHGRYVRLQLQGEGYLSLAELEVFAPTGKSSLD